MDDKAQAELLRLVEVEYDRTSKFIEGTVGIVTTVRGWAVTVWLALLGAALSEKLWEISVLAAVAPLVFMLVDAYHGSLYNQALLHAKDLERITGRHYAALSRGAAHSYAELNAQVALASHKYGLYSNLREFRWSDLLRSRPRVFVRVFYPVMIALGAVVAIALGVTAGH